MQGHCCAFGLKKGVNAVQKKRSAGVLMSVSALPSEFGIGGFGHECLDFIRFVAECGFSAWQVLPFNPVDFGNSPYASCSAFAGNYLYIDPVFLQKEGYLTHDEVAQLRYSGSPYTVDYEFVKTSKLKMLQLAFNRAGTRLALALQQFSVKNPWAEDYALYQVLKSRYDGKPWTEWNSEHSDYNRAAGLKNSLYPEMLFYLFEQYIFYKQWADVKQFAEKMQIKIIGDMPVYVALDSVDVWKDPQLFMLGEDFKPTEVSGVPPDAFSAEGQLWNNPIYRWQAHAKTGYAWWCSRVGGALALYDSVRIDHFRAFASYWSVPAGCATAKAGQWCKGPGKALFDQLFQHFSKNQIIAEDLGAYGRDVVELLEYCQIPGMRVVQFGFSGENSPHLPHNYEPNCVAYLGTHDNNTLLGWLWELDDATRCRVLQYCGFTGENWGEGGYYSPSCRKIIETVWRSGAGTVIIAFQDLCGFGCDARMNIPGVPEKNWRFRTTAETIERVDKSYFRQINQLFFRNAD